MKSLILGIDGCDYKVMSQFKLPNWEKIRAEYTKINIRQKDLWSRGWGELISGQHGSQTGALYARGTHLPGITSASVTPSMYSAHSTPIWDSLNSIGKKISLHNIPTTYPVPSIDGYAIAGGGGGIAANQSLQNGLYFPNDTFIAELTGAEYIRDVRFGTLKQKNFEFLFQQLNTMDDCHLDTFLRGNEHYNVDVGFLVLRSLVVIQQLFIDIIMNPDLDNGLFDKIEKFYIKFDEKLGNLIDRCNSDKVIIVSDHGQSIKEFSINLNTLFSNKSSGINDNLNRILSAGRYLAPRKLKNFVKKSTQLKDVSDRLKTDISRSAKFYSNRYIPGVYINPSIVKKNDFDHMKSYIVSEINSNVKLAKLGIRAFDSEEIYPVEQFPRRDLFPNVILEQPDNVFFESKGALISTNPNVGKKRIPENIVSDQHVGAKSKYPVCLASFPINCKSEMTLFQLGAKLPELIG